MEKLNPGRFYHIYNRAVGTDNLFLDHEDYTFFIRRFSEFALPVMEVYAYALLNNHFHFCVRIKDELMINKVIANNKNTGLQRSSVKVQNYISRQLSHVFNSYSQAFNKKYERSGNLFQRPFKRKLVKDESYLIKLVHYINCNPVKHGFSEKPHEWRYSSYNETIFNSSDIVSSEEVILLFNDVNNFKFCLSKESLFNFIP